MLLVRQREEKLWKKIMQWTASALNLLQESLVPQIPSVFPTSGGTLCYNTPTT